MSDPRLANLPALSELAEEDARRVQAALVTLSEGTGPTAGEPVPSLRALRDAHLALLSDLTRWQSQRAMEWLVAEAVGLKCGATAPSLTYDADFQGYVLRGPNEEVVFNEDGVIRSGAGETLAVPGVRDADPAEALAMIALHVLGSPDAR